MKHETVLLINGAQSQGVAKGQLNKTLFDQAIELLSPHFKILSTQVSEGYDIHQEQEKFAQADVVIFQYPVFWFSLPSDFKRYLDEVYEMGVFFGGSERYGEGGLMQGRRYMLSTTWNAPRIAFSKPDEFFEGQNTDEVLVGMHKAQQYVGMKPLPSFTAHDVVGKPEPDYIQQQWRQHLTQELLIHKEEAQASA